MASLSIPPAGAPLPMHTGGRPEISPELQRVAGEFEAIFVSEMLKPMFEGLDTDGLGGGGMGEEIFRPMLIERYADAIARAGGVGVADSIIAELQRLQTTEDAHGPAR